MQLMSRTISANIEAKPGISIFKLVDRNNLERFEKFQPDDYSLTDFQPGNIKLAIEDFGIRPILQRSGHDRLSDERINRYPVRAKNNAISWDLSAHEVEKYWWNPDRDPHQIEERKKKIRQLLETRSPRRRAEQE